MIHDIRTGQAPAALQPWSRPRPQAPAGGSTSVTAASATRDITASLSITTKEGDTVSISASFDTTATYAGVRGGGVRGGAWSASSSSQVSVEVQGNLSQQEMKDISRVVKTFLHDLGAMLKGREVSVANVAGGDPKTLQSVSATAATSTTITAVAGSFRPPPPQPGDTRVQPAGGDTDAVPRGVSLPQPVAPPIVAADAASPA